MDKHALGMRKMIKIGRPVSIDDFEDKNHNFICPFCGFEISSRRKSCSDYVLQAGDHYSACYDMATPEKRQNLSGCGPDGKYFECIKN